MIAGRVANTEDILPYLYGYALQRTIGIDSGVKGYVLRGSSFSILYTGETSEFRVAEMAGERFDELF